MPPRCRLADIGADRARTIVSNLAAEARGARIDRGLSQREVARALGISPSQLSRLERGLSPDLTIERAARVLAVVGMELSARAYPAGQPIRDAAHVALLERLRAQLHRSLRFRTEVPLPAPGDLRAWDATITGAGWWLGVEAESRPHDLQAAERRIALKARDSGADAAILLLADTRHNRALALAHRELLRSAFPLDGRRAVELLRAGIEPALSSVILL